MLRSALRYANPTNKTRSGLVATLKSTQTRLYSSNNSKRNPIHGGPAPPRLSKEDQEEFERLQRTANTSTVFQEYNKKAEAEAGIEPSLSIDEPVLPKTEAAVDFHYHPEYRHIKPEFEGNKNPVTGEVGGPKQDPLRHGDYSFNGRVTDF